MLSFLQCITHSLSLSLEDLKLIAITNWVLHVSDFLRLLISFKYSLILLRQSSTDNLLFLSPLLSYSI